MKRSDYWKCPKCKAINDVDCNYCECGFKNPHSFKRKESDQIEEFIFPKEEFDGFY